LQEGGDGGGSGDGVGDGLDIETLASDYYHAQLRTEGGEMSR
jgi:hypothetical protein